MSAVDENPYHLLPPELIAAILDNLIDDYRALFNVGLANKLMHDMSRRLLYRTMYSIFNAQSKNRKAGIPRNSNRAVLSVLKNLNLASYVLEYTIEDPAPLFGQSPSPLQSLRRGLHAMVNLRHLTIETYSPERWKLLFDFDSQFPAPRVPFQLETFACKGHDIRLTCTTSYADLSAFLHTQDRLRRVDVQLSRDSWEYSWEHKTGGLLERDTQMVPFPPSACPQLEWVIGNRAAIEALLPGRKVRVLQWKYCWSDARGSIRYLAKELGHLEVLALPDSGWLGVDPPVLQMAKYMRNLQYLEVQNTVSYPLYSLQTYPTSLFLHLNRGPPGFWLACMGAHPSVPTRNCSFGQPRQASTN